MPTIWAIPCRRFPVAATCCHDDALGTTTQLGIVGNHIYHESIHHMAQKHAHEG